MSSGPRTRGVIATALFCAAACRSQPAPPPAPIELDLGARGGQLQELDRAAAAGEPERVAAINGLLARDALARVRRILVYQTGLQDPATGLFAHSKGPPRWIPHHTGADLFPHLLIAATELAPELRPSILAALEAERRICGSFPCVIGLETAQPIELDLRRRIASATEYGADGLLPPSERFGAGPWRERLLESTAAVLERADVPSPVGLLPGIGAETHGNLLQVLARLGHREPDEARIAAGERLADAYLLHVAPRNRGLPAHRWDFARGAAESDRFRFRDHGAEILPGLAEQYFLERALGRPSAERHRAPLRALLAAALAVEREPDGLWRDELEVSTGKTKGGAIDTWGYVLASWAIVDLADGTDDYRPLVESMIAAAAARRDYAWEGESPDGPADAIESMLILLPFYPSAAGAAWVDQEVAALFRSQGLAGSAGAGYLDGNVIRSALLYADWKRAGVAAHPWRSDLALGAAREPDGASILLHLAADAPWQGRLRFDPPRHATHWGMKTNYPRRNSFPEWFPVEATAHYRVRELGGGRESRVLGSELLAGIEVGIERAGAGRSWRISRE